MIKQRLHVKKLLNFFLNSIKLCLLFSTEIFSTEYRDVAYVPRCPDTGSSSPPPPPPPPHTHTLFPPNLTNICK